MYVLTDLSYKVSLSQTQRIAISFEFMLALLVRFSVYYSVKVLNNHRRNASQVQEETTPAC